MQEVGIRPLVEQPKQSAVAIEPGLVQLLCVTQ